MFEIVVELKPLASGITIHLIYNPKAVAMLCQLIYEMAFHRKLGNTWNNIVG